VFGFIQIKIDDDDEYDSFKTQHKTRKIQEDFALCHPVSGVPQFLGLPASSSVSYAQHVVAGASQHCMACDCAEKVLRLPRRGRLDSNDRGRHDQHRTRQHQLEAARDLNPPVA